MAASAGRNASRRSSETVTSTVGTEVRERRQQLQLVLAAAQPQRHGEAERVVARGRSPASPASSSTSASRRSSGFCSARSRRRSTTCHAHSSKLTIRGATGPSRQARDVDHRLEPLRHDREERVVGVDQVAVAVDDHRRIGHVPAQDGLQRLAHGGELRRTASPE